MYTLALLEIIINCDTKRAAPTSEPTRDKCEIGVEAHQERERDDKMIFILLQSKSKCAVILYYSTSTLLHYCYHH